MNDTRASELLKEIADNPEWLEIGRKSIEDKLVEWRDDRMSSLMRNNGFVIKERNGDSSNVIRFGPEVGIKIALKAIAKHLAELNK